MGANGGVEGDINAFGPSKDGGGWTIRSVEIMLRMHKEGKTLGELSRQMSRTMSACREKLIEKGIDEAILPPVKSKKAPEVTNLNGEQRASPLPAGHPITWGLISNEKWPGTI